MKKKVFIFIFVLCMAFSWLLLTAAGFPDTTLGIIGSSCTASKGEVVTYYVTVDNNPGFMYLKLNINYDEDAMEIISVENGSIIETLQVNSYYLWTAGADSYSTGSLLTIRFLIKDTAEFEKYDIVIECQECFNYEENDVETDFVNGSINVVCNHLFGEYVDNEDGSCISNGTETATCTECGYQETRVKADSKKDHEWGTEWFGNGNGHWHVCKNCGTISDITAHVPGAEATGTTDQVCTVCESVLTPALGHVHTLEKQNRVESTCSAKGNIEYYLCTECLSCFADEDGLLPINNYYSIVIPEKAHTPVVDAAVEATCTTGGKTAGSHCSACGIVLVEQQYVEPQGHTWVITDNEDGSCISNGTETANCTECGYQETRVKADSKKDHEWGTEWFGNGNGHWHVCKNCGTISDITAHVPGAEATETTDQVCTVCGSVLTPALGHVHTLEKQNRVESTCSAKGNIEYYLCTECLSCFADEDGLLPINNYYSIVIPEKAHTPVEDAAVEATCTTGGKTAGSHCSACGIVLVEQQYIAPVGHTIIYDNAIEATWEHEGKTAGSHCDTCKEIFVEQQTIEKLSAGIIFRNNAHWVIIALTVLILICVAVLFVIVFLWKKELRRNQAQKKRTED